MIVERCTGNCKLFIWNWIWTRGWKRKKEKTERERASSLLRKATERFASKMLLNKRAFNLFLVLVHSNELKLFVCQSDGFAKVWNFEELLYYLLNRSAVDRSIDKARHSTEQKRRMNPPHCPRNSEWTNEVMQIIHLLTHRQTDTHKQCGRK